MQYHRTLAVLACSLLGDDVDAMCAYDRPGVLYNPAEAQACLAIGSPEALMRDAMQKQWTVFCEARLASFQAAGIPKLVMFPILTEEYRKSHFAIERAWRAAFSSHGFVRTAMQTEATFIVSKQPRYDLLSFGKMCPETQMFNHIPRQEVFADKVNVVRMLRSLSVEGLSFEDVMLPTFVFDGSQSDGSSASDLAEWEGFKKEVPLINAAAEKDDDIMWIHKKRGVENSEGITLISAATARALAEGREAGVKSPLQMAGVLQQYLRSPFLINGRKTEFRVFLLIASVKPLAAFSFKDFYVRISPEEYKRDANGLAAFTSVESLLHRKDGATGGISKDEILEKGYMNPEQFSSYMSTAGLTEGRHSASWLSVVFYPKLKRLLSIVLRAGLPQLSDLPGYFSLFGLDLLMDENHKLHFSEMNYSPGLAWVDVGNYRKEMSTRLVSEIVGIQTAVIRYRMACAGKSSCDKEIMDEIRSALISGEPLAYEKVDGNQFWYRHTDSSKPTHDKDEL